MANVAYTQYLREVRGEVGDCPEIIAINEIRNAVISFCQQTTLWRVDHDPISVVADTSEYSLVLSEGAASGVGWAYMTDSIGDEYHLEVTSEDALDNGSVRRVKLWRTKKGTPSKIYMPDPTKVRLVVIPESAYTLYMGLWIKPTRSSTDAPDWIYEKYLEAIAAGAKARILNQKTRPWYNPEAAMLEELEFKDRCSAAKADATKNHTRMSKTVMMRPIA